MHSSLILNDRSMPPQVLHFHDPRIINPDVRDELLQAIYKLLQSAVSAMPCLSSANDCPDHHGSNAAKGEPSLNWAPNASLSCSIVPVSKATRRADGACLAVCRIGCRCLSRMARRGRS